MLIWLFGFWLWFWLTLSGVLRPDITTNVSIWIVFAGPLGSTLLSWLIWREFLRALENSKIANEKIMQKAFEHTWSEIKEIKKKVSK